MKVRDIKKKLFKEALLQGKPFAFKLFGVDLKSFGSQERDYSRTIRYGAFGKHGEKIKNSSFSGIYIKSGIKPRFSYQKKVKHKDMVLLKPVYYLQLNPWLIKKEDIKPGQSDLSAFITEVIKKRSEFKKALKPGEIAIFSAHNKPFFNPNGFMVRSSKDLT